MFRNMFFLILKGLETKAVGSSHHEQNGDDQNKIEAASRSCCRCHDSLPTDKYLGRFLRNQIIHDDYKRLTIRR